MSSAFENEKVEKAIKDGSQQEALVACTKALRELPRESQIRVLASLLVLLNMDVDVFHRLQATVRR